MKNSTKFKFLIASLLLIHLLKVNGNPQNGFVDNEFAEFEVADEQSADVLDALQEPESVSERIADEDKHEQVKSFQNEEDFAFFSEPDNDDEEFEGMEKKPQVEEQDNTIGNGDKKSGDIKPLTFADVPAHFRSHWSSYQVEALALVIILLYVLNYVYGKSQNHSIAYNWFLQNRDQLEQQFSLCGDDGTAQEPTGGHLIKETDYSYTVWSSGRAGCQGMLTQIKLVKRQDLLGWTTSLFRPKPDRVIHKVELDAAEMDSFVLIFGNKKSVLKAVKELADLTERKNTDKFVMPPNFAVFAEVAETIPSFIDAGTLQFIKKYEKYIEYIHFSDQYSGAKAQDNFREACASRLPETAPTLFFSFFLLGNEEAENVYKGLLNFIFLMIERVRRYRLSKEGKAKADKKRQTVEEMFLKTTHLQRQEAAQARREEKTRERKQKVMEEEDPERQRRLEKIEQKRESKQRQPRMKQFKIK